MREAPGQYRDRELRDRHRLTRRSAALAAILLVFAAGVRPAHAEWKSVVRDGFSLRYDDADWAEQAPPAPPSILTLRCVAPACSAGSMVTFVRDPRPLVAPGFGAFGPGAATGAAVDLRVQSLTPGARILARRPARPVVLGGTSGYRGVYDVEDRALAKTAAIVVLLRLPAATLEARMAAARLSESDAALFDRLTSGLGLAE